jgi:hypothetical protein
MFGGGGVTVLQHLKYRKKVSDLSKDLKIGCLEEGCLVTKI